MRLCNVVAVAFARKRGICPFSQRSTISFKGRIPRAAITAGVDAVRIISSLSLRTFGSSSFRYSISCLPMTTILLEIKPFKYPARLRPGRLTSALRIEDGLIKHHDRASVLVPARARDPRFSFAGLHVLKIEKFCHVLHFIRDPTEYQRSL